MEIVHRYFSQNLCIFGWFILITDDPCWPMGDEMVFQVRKTSVKCISTGNNKVKLKKVYSLSLYVYKLFLWHHFEWC